MATAGDERRFGFKLVETQRETGNPPRSVGNQRHTRYRIVSARYGSTQKGKVFVRQLSA
jgi:hypothetical protein